MNPQQAALFDVLNEAISSQTTVSFVAVDQNDALSQQVRIGDHGRAQGISPLTNQHVIDVGDMATLGSNGLLTGQGALGHEIKEGFEIQSKNLTTNAQITDAHAAAINAESKITGVRIFGANENIANSNVLEVTVSIPQVRGELRPAINTRVQLRFSNMQLINTVNNQK